MVNEKLEFKIEKVQSQIELAKLTNGSGSGLWWVLCQYEQKYGKGNVWINNKSICIASEVDPLSVEYVI